MKPNPGFQPGETMGKRVHVELVNGYRTDQPMVTGVHKDPNGWAADTCNWEKSDWPFSIAKWKLA